MILPEEYKRDRQWWDSGDGGRFCILEDWQQDAWEALFDRYHKVIALKGNTGCGKGAWLGMSAVAYYDVWNADGIVTITRDKYETAVKTTFGEVKRWWNRAAVKPQGYLMDGGVKHIPMHRMSVDCPRTDEGFSGEHTDHVYMQFDEATAVRPSLHDMALTQAHKIAKAFNPRVRSGPCRETYPKRDPDKDQTYVTSQGPIRCITISGERCTNVRMGCMKGTSAPVGGITIEGVRYEHGAQLPTRVQEQLKPIIPGQVCLDEWLTLKNHRDPDFVACFAHGRFPAEDPVHQLFKAAWFIRPNEKHKRWQRLWDIAHGRIGRKQWWIQKRYSDTLIRRLDRLLPVQSFGVDVATGRTEGDENVIAAGGKQGVRALHAAQLYTTTAIVQWVIDTAQNVYGITITNGGFPVGVDMDGAPGVGDGLAARGVRVIECRGNTSSVEPTRFLNKRAERFGLLADRMNPQGFNDYSELPRAKSDPSYSPTLDGDANVFAMPDDSMLEEELTAIEKVYRGADRMKWYVTPKRGNEIIDNYEKPARVITPLVDILKRSPDRADAVSYMFDACHQAGCDLDEWISQMYG